MMVRPKKLRFTCMAVLIVIGATLPISGGLSKAVDNTRLSAECPPSFELTRSGFCRLVTLYGLFAQDAGPGGLRAQLPSLVGGFTPQQIDLGRLLFFDPILSADRDISCAHCHRPDMGFGDGRGRAIGRTELERGSLPLWNVGFLGRFGWEGMVPSLEAQSLVPLLAENEMGGSVATVEAAINGVPAYQRLFAEAFGLHEGQAVQIKHVAKALAAFQSTLISVNSRYDRYAHGDAYALTTREIEGLTVFHSFVTRCSQCHTPPLFTNGEVAAIGAPEPPGRPFDHGAAGDTNDPKLNGVFRIPTLRNIAITAPYMHSGALESLEDVVGFYNDRRGHALPDGEHVNLHWHIHLDGPALSPDQADALVAFLGTLTDVSLTPLVPRFVPSGLPVIDLDATTPNSRVDATE